MKCMPILHSVLLPFYSNTSRPTKNKSTSKNTAPESSMDPVRHTQGSGSSLVRLFDPHVYKILRIHSSRTDTIFKDAHPENRLLGEYVLPYSGIGYDADLLGDFD